MVIVPWSLVYCQECEVYETSSFVIPFTLSFSDLIGESIKIICIDSRFPARNAYSIAVAGGHGNDSRRGNDSRGYNISMKKKIRVALGLSGGVDSAVSAYLLQKQGFDVNCVYLNCYDDDTPGCRGR